MILGIDTCKRERDKQDERERGKLMQSQQKYQPTWRFFRVQFRARGSGLPL
jgi:hypothetical protein